MDEDKQLIPQDDKETALAEVKPTINLPALVEPEAVGEIMAQNLSGMEEEMRFTKLTVPGGGGLSFTVVDENGKKIPVDKIEGVIIGASPYKAWYATSFDEKKEGDSKAPDCFSSDNRTGSGCDEHNIPAGQICANCPNYEWGSKRGGKGRDCQ